MQFILQLGLLVLAARLGGALLRFWKLPSVLGELAAGMLIGPHVLGSLPGAPVQLVGVAADFDVFAGNGLGGVIGLSLVVLLFLVGLESDLRILRRYSAAAVLVGAAGTLAALAAASAVVVFVAPVLLLRTFGWYDRETAFAAVAVAVTSIGLVARSLAGVRRMETPEGRIVLAGAALDNLFAVGLLVVACGLGLNAAAGQLPTPWLAARVLLKAVLVGGLLCGITLVVAHRIERVADPDRSTTGTAVYGLGCALLAGGVCWYLGLSPLLGAYVLGVALATTDLRHQIQDRLGFLHAAFVPACFAFVGARLEPALLVDPRVLGFALIFLLAVLLAQTLGVSAMAWFAGLNGLGCRRAGASLLPRGELTLAAILAALALDAMPAELLAAVVLLFLVAGVVAPVLTSWAFAHGAAGTRRGFAAMESLRLSFHFPSHQAAGLIVSRLIELFEDDGFYVGLLNRRDALYQFAREGSVLGVQRVGSEIIFTGDAADRDLIHNAMLEVAAGIEQGMRELREPLDAMTLRQRLQEESATGAPGAAVVPNAALRPFLTVEAMQPHLLASSKAGVIAELLELLHSRGLVHDRDAAARAVFDREQSLPTGLQNGVAIPHGRTEAVDRLVCAVGLKPEGVDFAALDGRPARIVVLVLAPLHAVAPQLRFLALVGQALHEQGRAALLACETSEDMYAVLAGVARAAPPRGGNRPASLAALAWQSVSLDLHARTREEALDQLLALCARSGAVMEPDVARQDVFTRVYDCPVGLEHGVALPHARTAAVQRMVCAFGISREGIDFGASDGEPAHIFVMALAPPSATTEYTRLMGVLTRALDAEGRQALLAARSSQEVLAILAARGREAG